ncbi:integrin beta-1 isoform X3 [Hydra vulgaris]|uniref:Integrin beta n=1 Tax=Hydra vulgaris TaxID=6087 RepID=A0ABM4B773_HYDVU
MDVLSFLYFIFVLQLGYVEIKGNFNDCQTKEDCGACIKSVSPQCAWCEDIFYNYTLKNFYKKCDLLENHEKQKCIKITNPPSSSKIEKAAQLEGETRVSPQAITVKLRPGQPVSVDIEVKTPKNFPIDLYYLMDMSTSMKEDLANIQTLGEDLANELDQVTENFRLGFGLFVDKDIGPYTWFWNEKVRSDTSVQQTFSFKNRLPLNENKALFGEAVKNTKISYNVDSPEGSLEALLQVVVCEKEIGWRNKKKARRIVILTTDGTFHFSGDGLLGGFVLPSDGKCHLENNDYIGWNKFDYPSLSQIRALMAENEIVPIFATTGNTDLYNKVASFFGQASGAVAARLNNDSSNVVPLIKEAYLKIAQVVNIRADPPKGVDIKFRAKCSKGKLTLDQSFCNDVDIGEQVTFSAEMKTSDCSNAEKDLDFLIKTNFDDVSVKLQVICECPCGNTSIQNSEQCSKRGNLSCGICFCDKEKFAGRFCQCTLEEANNQTLCRVPNVESVCSGKGDCECGECICNKGTLNEFGEIDHIYGDQCQCSNTTCGRSNGGKLCGGPDRGMCDCGKCLCNANWQGNACEEQCDKGTSMCMNNDGVECSGKGTCKCNNCVCNAGYIGDLCQECVSNCPDACQDFRECVKCKVFDTSDLKKEQCELECTKWNISSYKLQDKVPEVRRCIVRDEDDCSFVFSYNKNNITGEIQLLVQRERICPAEPDILAIILGVIAGIVGIGLALLLIWKLLATIQDRREFARFDKETKNAKWNTGENPIFKQATSTFQNPMYGNQPQETPEEHVS